MCGRCHYCNVGRPVLCDQQGKALSTMFDGTLRTRDAAGNPLTIKAAPGEDLTTICLTTDRRLQITACRRRTPSR